MGFSNHGGDHHPAAFLCSATAVATAVAFGASSRFAAAGAPPPPAPGSCRGASEARSTKAYLEGAARSRKTLSCSGASAVVKSFCMGWKSKRSLCRNWSSRSKVTSLQELCAIAKGFTDPLGSWSTASKTSSAAKRSGAEALIPKRAESTLLSTTVSTKAQTRKSRFFSGPPPEGTLKKRFLAWPLLVNFSKGVPFKFWLCNSQVAEGACSMVS
mmetsp:Transcript_41913/g.91414  ORF Transcript_41913/g.91414 Transcript_41913/m.91414 type:complete len:214 (-) Transcript_41913:118-759(-)